MVEIQRWQTYDAIEKFIDARLNLRPPTDKDTWYCFLSFQSTRICTPYPRSCMVGCWHREGRNRKTAYEIGLWLVLRVCAVHLSKLPLNDMKIPVSCLNLVRFGHLIPTYLSRCLVGQLMTSEQNRNKGHKAIPVRGWWNMYIEQQVIQLRFRTWWSISSILNILAMRDSSGSRYGHESWHQLQLLDFLILNPSFRCITPLTWSPADIRKVEVGTSSMKGPPS